MVYRCVCVCVCVYLCVCVCVRVCVCVFLRTVTTSRRRKIWSGQILVTRLDDRTVTIDIKPNDTVLSVVKQVPGSERLIFRDK